MNARTYLNSPMHNCANCAHRSGRAMFSFCIRSGRYIERQRLEPNEACDQNFSGWHPRPRRRSLLRWLWDNLFAWR